MFLKNIEFKIEETRKLGEEIKNCPIVAKKSAIFRENSILIAHLFKSGPLLWQLPVPFWNNHFMAANHGFTAKL